MFLKLIESRKTKFGWDYSCVKFLNCGMRCFWVPPVPPSWRDALGAKPANESRLHCRKIAVTELLFLERFEQTQLLPRSVTQTEVLSVEQCSSTCRFLLLFLWFTVTSL